MSRALTSQTASMAACCDSALRWVDCRVCSALLQRLQRECAAVVRQGTIVEHDDRLQAAGGSDLVLLRRGARHRDARP